ncbi:MAG: hypothetical protein WA194_06035 [Patescibacteria group bacterium]
MYHKDDFLWLTISSLILVVTLLTSWHYGSVVYRNVRRRFR